MAQRRKTHAAKLLEALSDGRSWSTPELVEYGCGFAVHSRASDLRKLGYAVEVTRRRTSPGQNDVYFYRLVALPQEPSRLEELVDDAAAVRLHALRRHDPRAAVAQSGERDVANVEAVGSSPTSRSTLASPPVGNSAVSGSAPVQREPEQAIDAGPEGSQPSPLTAGADPGHGVRAGGLPAEREEPEQLALLAGEPGALARAYETGEIPVGRAA